MRALTIHAAKDLRVETSSVADPGPGEVRIAVRTGGICGSDLHYYNHGGFGSVRLREPMILGHEVAGVVADTGNGVHSVKPGDLVAVNPSRPCGACRFCDAGHFNHCLNMRFYGSAMPFPHVQGAFRDRLVVDEAQCFAVSEGVSAGNAAMAEPLSVCLHAVAQAGNVEGRRLLITGCGPIGALCVMAARHAGAAEITVTDLTDSALAFAARVGADRTINMAKDAGALKPFAEEKGYFDLAIEASGSGQALASALGLLRPRGTLVQLGLGGEMTVAMNALVSKEIVLKGSFRFHEDFGRAVTLINAGEIDVASLISETVPVEDAVAAFDLASDRSQAMKVQLLFN